jgi:hypothetical protein
VKTLMGIFYSLVSALETPYGAATFGFASYCGCSAAHSFRNVVWARHLCIPLEKLEQIARVKAPPITNPDDNFCRELSFKTFSGVVFMVERGRVTRATSSRSLPTTVGVTVGSSLKAAENSSLAPLIEPNRYDPAGHYVIFKSPDGKRALILEEVGGKITDVRGGLEPSVEYVEGCL